MLFGADTPAPLDAVRLDGTTEATLVRSLSALPADERGWVTFAEAKCATDHVTAPAACGWMHPDPARSSWSR